MWTFYRCIDLRELPMTFPRQKVIWLNQSVYSTGRLRWSDGDFSFTGEGSAIWEIKAITSP